MRAWFVLFCSEARSSALLIGRSRSRGLLDASFASSGAERHMQRHKCEPVEYVEEELFSRSSRVNRSIHSLVAAPFIVDTE